MKEAKIVIGANFGDEGKGLMTDFFCSRFDPSKPILNVRFNGGSQAGHTVVTPKGESHIFSHLGSGSFLPNVATYLSKDFIVNPISFYKQYVQFVQDSNGLYPMIYAHPRCMITMAQDMMINQIIETRRGKDRHGSCGMGIYETILRDKVDRAVRIKDFKKIEARGQIDLNYYDSERIETIFNVGLTDKEKALLNNQNIRAHYNQDVQFFMDHVTIADESIFKRFDNVVFEGAQGLMLDQNNSDYFPHLTPSNTGIENVLGYLDSDTNVEVCYVSRPYLTRHGAGRLDNECSREVIGAKPDLTNHLNQFQGVFRYAPLDFDDMYKRAKSDFDKIYTVGCPAKMSICVTHVDEFMDHLIKDPQSTFIPDIVRPIFYDPNERTTYISRGRTRNDVFGLYKKTM